MGEEHAIDVVMTIVKEILTRYREIEGIELRRDKPYLPAFVPEVVSRLEVVFAGRSSRIGLREAKIAAYTMICIVNLDTSAGSYPLRDCVVGLEALCLL